MTNIEINGPKTLTLTPQTLATVLDALSELAFKKANPAIQEIFAQLQTPVPVEVPKDKPPAHEGANGQATP